MSPVSAEAIRAQAEFEIRDENFKAAVVAEKARLRNHKTVRQRLTALLPFTITWKSK